MSYNPGVELGELARAIVLADSLAGKLAPIPARVSDRVRGPALRIAAPGRPREL